MAIPPIIAPRVLLSLGYSVGRAQSCFLTIPHTLAASLTRLALHLHSAPWILYPIAAPHICICAYSFAPCYIITSNRRYRARAHALHATTSSCAITPTATGYAPHNLHPGGRTRHMRRHARARTYHTHARIHDYTIVHARSICIHI